MYAAYLSYSQVQEYVTFLQERELIFYEQGMQKYKLTEKGLRFLHVYEQISELISLPNTRLATNATKP
jgi:predicted transcriptional regulator